MDVLRRDIVTISLQPLTRGLTHAGNDAGPLLAPFIFATIV